MRSPIICIRLCPLIAGLLAFTIFTAPVQGQAQCPSKSEAPLIKGNRRVVVVMVDVLGPDYVEQSAMPVLKNLMAKGFSKTVEGVMPPVTNVDNASICRGSWPKEHEITGNSFFDESRGQAEYMEDASYLLRPTAQARRVLPYLP